MQPSLGFKNQELKTWFTNFKNPFMASSKLHNNGLSNYPQHWCLQIKINPRQITSYSRKPQIALSVLIYVDDIIIVRNELEGIKMIEENLHSNFKIRDLRNLRYFLSIEVACILKWKLFKSTKICSRITWRVWFSWNISFKNSHGAKFEIE